jgi:multiple sugar transport system substrate-binding protein
MVGTRLDAAAKNWTGDTRHARRSALLGAGATGLAVLAAACGAQGEATQPAARSSGEQVTLRHTPWPGIPSSRAAQTGIVEAWNQRHPDVQVREEELAGTGSLYQKLLVQTAAGTPPDLSFMQGTYDYVSFVTKNLLLPIEGYIKKDRSFNQAERLHPRSRDIVELLGHTWGLPVEAATYVIWYNRGLFEQAGVPLPTKGWTWQDLLDRARRLTRDLGSEMQYGYAQGLNFGRMEPWIVQNGARVLDKVAFPTRQRFDAPDVIAAVQYTHDLAWKHRVMPAGDAPSGIAKMWEGKQAMRQDGHWLSPDFAQNMKAPWGMAPLPKGKQDARWLSIDVNVAFKATRHPEECYEFLKFINKEGQKWMIEHWGRMPVTSGEEAKQTYIKYLKNLGVENWEVSWEAWQTGYSSHMTPAWPELDREVVAPAFSALFGKDGEKASVSATFQSMAPKAQQILTEQGQPPKL